MVMTPSAASLQPLLTNAQTGWVVNYVLSPKGYSFADM